MEKEKKKTKYSIQALATEFKDDNISNWTFFFFLTTFARREMDDETRKHRKLFTHRYNKW